MTPLSCGGRYRIRTCVAFATDLQTVPLDLYCAKLSWLAETPQVSSSGFGLFNPTGATNCVPAAYRRLILKRNTVKTRHPPQCATTPDSGGYGLCREVVRGARPGTQGQQALAGETECRR